MRWIRGLPAWAPYLLLASMIARLVWIFTTTNGFNVVDLHVYVECSATLRNDDLYDCTYSEDTPDFPLPFTYPPFAAMVFFPLHLLPFDAVVVAWQILTVAALFGVVRIALELLGTGDHRIAALWTAGGVWTEPVRSTLDYGQVNVFLALGVMLAVRSSRWWLSGLLVGVVGGIKLTPAVSGLYFAARRRWATVAWSAAVFAATVGLSYAIVGDEARRYFEHLLGDASRIGPVGSVFNQSLRGALSRIAGHDVGTSALWLSAVGVAVVLAVCAWRALRPDDRLGTILLVQFLGLLISPISWSHHWVWVIPLLVWLVHGPDWPQVGTKVVAAFWALDIVVGVPWLLGFFQPDIWTVSRPSLLAWLGTVNVVGTLLLFAWVIYLRRVRKSAAPAAYPALSGRLPSA